jgi:small subunit ribosomal protein S11
MANPKKGARQKRARKNVEAEGVAHIKATFNNTLITITDMHGNVVTWGSSGKAGFKGSKKSTPFAATVAAEQCGREAVNLGMKRVHVRCRGRAAAGSRRSRRWQRRGWRCGRSVM